MRARGLRGEKYHPAINLLYLKIMDMHSPSPVGNGLSGEREGLEESSPGPTSLSRGRRSGEAGSRHHQVKDGSEALLHPRVPDEPGSLEKGAAIITGCNGNINRAHYDRRIDPRTVSFEVTAGETGDGASSAAGTVPSRSSTGTPLSPSAQWSTTALRVGGSGIPVPRGPYPPGQPRLLRTRGSGRITSASLIPPLCH